MKGYLANSMYRYIASTSRFEPDIACVVRVL